MNVTVSCTNNAAVVSKTITYMANNGSGVMVSHTANVYYPGSLAAGVKRPVIVSIPGWGGAGDVGPSANNYWATQGYVAVNVGFKFIRSWESNLWDSVDGALDALQADSSVPADNSIIALNGTSYGGTQTVVVATNIRHKNQIRAVLAEDAGYTWWDSAINTAFIAPSSRPFSIAMQENQADGSFPIDSCEFTNCGIRNRARSHQNSGNPDDRKRVYSNCPPGGSHGARPAGWDVWKLDAMKQMLHVDYGAPPFAGSAPSVTPTNACL